MYKPYYHASIRPKAKALSSPSSVHSSESQKKKEQKRVSELPNSAPEEAKNKKSNKENSNSNQEVYIEFFWAFKSCVLRKKNNENKWRHIKNHYYIDWVGNLDGLGLDHNYNTVTS